MLEAPTPRLLPDLFRNKLVAWRAPTGRFGIVDTIVAIQLLQFNR
jgi:hypothetical protein